MKKTTQLLIAILFMTIGLASANNLIEDWDGNGATGAGSEPNQFGWEYTSADMAWGIVNAGGNRYRDGLNKSHEDGKDMSGHRQFMVRWDIGGTTADYYNYPVTLEAGKAYEFYWDYSWGNTGSDPAMTVSVGMSKDGSDAIASKVFSTPATKELYRSGSFTFAPETGGQYYLKITSNTGAWYGATNMSITELPQAEDVTDTYLTNANFEIDPTGLANDVTIYDVTGWTEVPASVASGAYQKLGTVLCGETYNTAYVGTAPANNSSVITDSVVLVIKEHWNADATNKLYVEQTATLPAGTYTYKWDSYVTQTLENQTSRCGYVIDGVASYSTIASSLDAWETQRMTLSLTESSDVTFRVGYFKNANTGSTTSPILFIDNVKLTKEVDPILNVSSSLLTFDDQALTATFKVSGANLSEDITITGANSFSVDETTVAQAGTETTITVTFDGLEDDRDYINISSSNINKRIRVIGRINDAPLYTTGNLISNPYFNTLDSYTGWGNRSISTDTLEVYNGKGCLKTVGSCGGSIDYSVTGAIEANTYYTLRAMAKTTGNYKFIFSGWGVTEGKDITDATSPYLSFNTDGEWKQVSTNVFTGGSMGASQNLYINSCEGLGGTLAYIDNYELYKMPMYISESALEFLEAGDKTVAVTGQTLTEDITITAPEGFSVSPTTLGSTADASVVTITYAGNATTSGYVKFTSGIYADSVLVEGVADPTMVVSETFLTFDELETSATFTVLGGNLTEDIAITAPTGFSVDNAVVGQSSGETTITVTYEATADARDYITIASSGISKRVRVIGRINSPLLYTTGNLISNPYLNTQDGFSGWGAGNRTIETDTAIVYSGKACLKSVGDCGNSFDYELGNALISDTYYRYLIMLKSTGSYRVAFKNAYINDEKEGNHNVPSTDGEWAPFDFKFKTGTVEADQFIFFNSCGDQTGTLAYIDNYQLYKMPIHLAADSVILEGVSDSTVTITAQLANTDAAFAITTPAGISADAMSVDADGTIDLSISFDNSANVEGYVLFDNGTYADSIYVKGSKKLPTTLSAKNISQDKVFVSNNLINIKVAINAASQVAYKVYNLQGSLVASELQHYTAGVHQTVLKANLANGIYLVKVTKEGRSQTYKIVK